MRSVHERLYEARRTDPPTLVQPPPSLVIAFASFPHVCRAVPFTLRIWWECGGLSCNFSVFVLQVVCVHLGLAIIVIIHFNLRYVIDACAAFFEQWTIFTQKLISDKATHSVFFLCHSFLGYFLLDRSAEIKFLGIPNWVREVRRPF
ncbi:hypothetical protein GUJ93_ZPchr0011g27284 [Zizania palustris]|uniref:Uncharacterized protein n=1 Tax=Zizania palustris TaxID=103762 RepID=A0A8J5WFF3_ZIZPA|nr:hypothetical protein GUJ93_ZPchr0011g27284 [Zizania palustris]